MKRVFEDASRTEALRRLAARLESRARQVALSGTTGGARPFAIAQAILAEKRSVAVLTNTNADAQSLAAEIRFFLELLSPDPLPVIHLPGLEVDPYRGLSPHPEVAAARAQAVHQLLQDGPRVLTTSINAAATRMHGPQRFLSRCLQIREGEEHSPEAIRRYLHESGYVEDDPVTDPGEFSIRGGILDIFPSHLDQPVRVEFWGDTVESLRTFDADSQRSVSQLQQFDIIPMKDYCPDERTLRRWAEEAPSHWSSPFLPHLEEELALARQGEPFAAFEFMLPAVDPPGKSVFDFLDGFRIITLDEEVLCATLTKYHAGLYERYLDRIEAHKPALAPGQIYMTCEEFQRSLERFPLLRLEELRVGQEESGSIHLSCQAARKYHGNIRELIADLKRFADDGERVVFLFANLGRAERMGDILDEYGM